MKPNFLFRERLCHCKAETSSLSLPSHEYVTKHKIGWFIRELVPPGISFDNIFRIFHLRRKNMNYLSALSLTE